MPDPTALPTALTLTTATAPAGPSAGLSPAVVTAVLGAALLHATWNALAHGTPDRLIGFAMMGVAETVGGAVLVAFTGLPGPGAWPYLLASAAVHVGYVLLLLAGYQLGEFSQVYPLARGSAPLLVTAVSVLLLGRALPLWQLLGILAVSAGLLALVVVGGSRARLPAVAAALGTGATIAAYTVIDGIGVGQGPVLAYIGWLFLLHGPTMPIVAVLRGRHRSLGAARGSVLPGLAGGLISLAAYGLVLWAQTSGALAPIAALRESSIVFGALIGAVFLGEPLGRPRALAAAVVVAGVVVLAL